MNSNTLGGQSENRTRIGLRITGIVLIAAAGAMVAGIRSAARAEHGSMQPAGARIATPSIGQACEVAPTSSPSIRPSRIQDENVVLCQGVEQVQGPQAAWNCGCMNGGRHGFEDSRFAAWQAYAQGSYLSPARTAHVQEYRLRVDDQLDMLYRLTREETATPYRLNVGDEIKVESFTDPDINRELLIQPDGTITLRLLGQVHATGKTVTQLRDTIDELYKKYYKMPSITVTPLKVNTQLDDLRAVIDRRQGVGGQQSSVRITPDGTIALTAIGNVQAQGLTLAELRQEINARYREKIEGMEVIPTLTQRASRYCYVLGEVRTPGRFEMTGPTTILQSIAMAGSWNVGANIAQVVVFRRGDDWQLMATMVDLQGALRGKQACPRGEIWLSDSDVIIVPKGRILEVDDFISLVFTRGLYGAIPLQPTVTFQKLSTI